MSFDADAQRQSLGKRGERKALSCFVRGRDSRTIHFPHKMVCVGPSAKGSPGKGRWQCQPPPVMVFVESQKQEVSSGAAQMKSAERDSMRAAPTKESQPVSDPSG